MALINIKDSTRDEINELIPKIKKANPDLKVNQAYIVDKGVKLLKGEFK